jgi:hypothetical protein
MTSGSARTLRLQVGLSDELTRQREARKQLQSQIDALVSSDAGRVDELDSKVAAATDAVKDARDAFRKAADGNQIYRLAASWYRESTVDVTAEQFASARWVFTTFSAVCVALAGTIAALVYYSRSRVPGARSFVGESIVKLIRAGRAYYARLRKRLIVERVVYRDGKEPPVVVEKEVVRPIDRIVLIPRWGIKFPIYINSLIRRGEPGSGGGHDRAAIANFKLAPLKKAN